MQALQSHPFFKGIDWSSLRSIPSPIKKAINPLKGEEKETDYYKENVRKRKVLLSGLIRKYKKLLFYDTRQLILYDNGTMEYFDPEDGVMKVGPTDAGHHRSELKVPGHQEGLRGLRPGHSRPGIQPEMPGIHCRRVGRHAPERNHAAVRGPKADSRQLLMLLIDVNYRLTSSASSLSSLW